MILRRVIEHFRKQEWTAIFLDFVIVVVGVFVGIQVANWNTARADDARAYGYLERISDDLDADIAGYRLRVDFWSEVSEFGMKGLAFAESRANATQADWPMLLAYFHASQVGEFFTTDTTYEELKNAGELRLVGDPTLRGRLAGYYVNSSNPAMVERPAYREHVRSVIPIAIQSHIWEKCYFATPAGGQKLLDCPPPPGEPRIAEIVDRIARDAELMGELTYWVSSMRIARIIAMSQISNAEALRDSINAKLRQSKQGGAP